MVTILIKKLHHRNINLKKILFMLYLSFYCTIKKFLNYFENDFKNNYSYNYYGIPVNLFAKITKQNIDLKPELPNDSNQINSRNYDLEVIYLIITLID